MDDFDWIDRNSGERFHSAIYNCPECNKKVSFDDNFCRHCGVKFTPAMCNHMKQNLKLLSDSNFKHLVVIMLIVLVFILGTVLS
ncbi:zinc ribbon domain-containing protein [Neptunomonas phycophila]|uniref:zinc ribbon domain-containing protein n=1 Tax=Neptunomonas phycophila TaxID=1572645 RepID=UPI0037359F23